MKTIKKIAIASLLALSICLMVKSAYNSKDYIKWEREMIKSGQLK